MKKRPSLLASRVMSGWLLAVMLFAPAISAVSFAMTELVEEDLGEVTGEGLAFPFENFRLEMAKTSYIELTGRDTNLCTPGSTSSPVGCTTFRRGDLRYYGLTMSSGALTSGTDWYGNGCTPGTYGLGCPTNTGAIVNYSNFDNPFLMRVFNYSGKYGTTGNLVDRTVLELIGPSNSDPFRWAFYGEVESGRTYGAADVTGYRDINGATCAAGTGNACLLQTQNIILGKPASRLMPPSIGGTDNSVNYYNGAVLRLFQYMGTTADSGPNPSTFGLQYESRLSGDYRLSVNTQNGTHGVRGSVPDFTDQEGLYFRNVEAYLPLGQLHYQALVADDLQDGSSGAVNTNGNFILRLSRIPNASGAYNDFYSMNSGCANSTVDCGYQRTGLSGRYYETHGYVEWGDKFPSCVDANCMSGTGVSQIRFSGSDPDGPTYNISSAIRSCESSNSCTWTGQVGAVFSNTNGDPIYNTGYTRDQVIGAGGMSFVSRNSASTWTVLHNQNRAQRDYNLVNASSNSNGYGTNDMMQRASRGCGFLGTCYDYSARNYGADYNPAITMSAINLGASRVEGLLIQHMSIRTLGAQ